ncbi:DUF5054 domain-containing protein [Sporosarcina sp. YIM B06819]|uniref:DUF5054 domain-containing protein n=1 Tax=Sporosarcina sp. YIM B06819 TaxID=3081769 RepID=UPI00298BEF93|nr:DUF5054 domain-containing protein [Sporosarcina sp. YIM B06819]
MKKKMHIVFKTHLDIGFTDLAEKVVENYVNEFIPRALDLGEALQGKFVWTTGSWLIDYYLTSSDVAEVDKERMVTAIKAGTIKWHGLPVTVHTELMDRRLFDYGLSISQKLDQQFQTTTIAAKMTDIPGHTIAMVPLMANAGLRYLHIGVNDSSAVPNVPEMFVWRAKDGSEIVVHYAKSYGATFEREGWDDLLYFAHSHDNYGPPQDVQEVEELYQKLEQQYPGVEFVASGLDEFAQVAWDKRASLPVIEEEIADSWIHGVGSDPLKIAQYEMLLALREQWLAEGTMQVDSQEYNQFSGQLLLVAEHTWGGNGNVFLPDYRNYLIADFNKAREKDQIEFNRNRGTMDFADLMASISTDVDNPDDAAKRSYKLYEASWQEQRDYIQRALDSLSVDHRKQADEKFAEAASAIVDMPLNEAIVIGKTYNFGDFELAFSETGGIQKLKVNQVSMLEAGKRFGELSYERFDFSNFTRFLSQYSRLTRWTSGWALGDFAKRGIEAHSEIRHELIYPHVEQSNMSRDNGLVKFDFDLKFEEHCEENYGIPKKIRLSYLLDCEKKTIEGIMQWEHKQANRMPEAYWLESSLSVANPYRWQMHKLGEPISPYNVVVNGNRSMHALSREGLTYSGTEGRVAIRSQEAPLFSFGRRSLLTFDNAQPSLNDGIYINLFNNVWGTNFPAWFEGDICYHFGATLAIE